MLINIGEKPESDFDDPVGMLRDCHKRIRHFLETQAFAAKKFHGLPLPKDVASSVLNSLRYFRDAAPNHTADEEKSLFPRMRTSVTEEKSAALMQSLEHEHRWAESQHELVDSIFRAWISNGSSSAEETEKLMSTLTQLEAFYDEHMQHEECTLFPLAEGKLSSSDLACIGAEMAERRGLKFCPSR